MRSAIFWPFESAGRSVSPGVPPWRSAFVVSSLTIKTVRSLRSSSPQADSLSRVKARAAPGALSFETIVRLTRYLGDLRRFAVVTGVVPVARGSADERTELCSPRAIRPAVPGTWFVFTGFLPGESQLVVWLTLREPWIAAGWYPQPVGGAVKPVKDRFVNRGAPWRVSGTRNWLP